MYRVCLIGASLSTGNMGVSALAASLVNLIRRARPDAEIAFFIGSRNSTPQILKLPGGIERIQIINYRLSPEGLLQRHLLWILLVAALQRYIPFKAMRKKIVCSNPCLRALSEADFIGDIHGGDSFSDIYGIKSFIFGCIPDFIVLLLGKKLVLLPQTYGPYASHLAKRIAKIIIDRAEQILSRDYEGLNVVMEISANAYDCKRTYFCPDVALSLAAMCPSNPAITPSLPSDNIIGLNISGLLYNGGFGRNNMFGLKFDYKSFIHALVERLLNLTEVHLLLVPHTFAHDGHVESDPEACRAVMSTKVVKAQSSRVHFVAAECNQSEIKGIISLCDFFIGSRMHACIAALSQGIPTVGLAYSRKFKGVFDSIGVGDMVIDARITDADNAIRSILKMYTNRKVSEPILREKIQIAMQLLMGTFCSALGLKKT